MRCFSRQLERRSPGCSTQLSSWLPAHHAQAEQTQVIFCFHPVMCLPLSQQKVQFLSGISRQYHRPHRSSCTVAVFLILIRRTRIHSLKPGNGAGKLKKNIFFLNLNPKSSVRIQGSASVSKCHGSGTRSHNVILFKSLPYLFINFRLRFSRLKYVPEIIVPFDRKESCSLVKGMRESGAGKL